MVSFLIAAFHRYPWFSLDVDLGVQIHNYAFSANMQHTCLTMSDISFIISKMQDFIL